MRGRSRASSRVPGNEGPEWDAARVEGCESPQELNLLKAIRADGSLPEPTKQHEVWDGNSPYDARRFRIPGRRPEAADLRRWSRLAFR